MEKYRIQIGENKKEATQHGSPEFPLAIYTTQIQRNLLGFIDWHWHNELQFCIVTEGTVLFRVNHAECPVSRGDGIFINAKQLHKAENLPGTDSTYVCLDFLPSLISGFSGSAIHTKYVLPYAGNDALPYFPLKRGEGRQDEILQALSAIYRSDQLKPDLYELDVLQQLVRIWRALAASFFSSCKNDSSQSGDLRMKKIVAYLHQHYMEKVELVDVAGLVNLSRSACCREFKKHMKCTIFEYLTNYRLVTASQLLLSTDRSVTDIAYQCGFGSTSYFIEKFRLKSGVTPSAYRKNRQLPSPLSHR